MKISAFEGFENEKFIDEQPECKGLVFRGHRSEYFNPKAGKVEKKQNISLLKRKSCKGCDKCSPILDQLNDMVDTEGLVWPEEDIEDFALYSIRVTNISKDFMSGIVDDYDFEIYKLNES